MEPFKVIYFTGSGNFEYEIIPLEDMYLIHLEGSKICAIAKSAEEDTWKVIDDGQLTNDELNFFVEKIETRV